MHIVVYTKFLTVIPLFVQHLHTSKFDVVAPRQSQTHNKYDAFPCFCVSLLFSTVYAAHRKYYLLSAEKVFFFFTFNQQFHTWKDLSSCFFFSFICVVMQHSFEHTVPIWCRSVINYEANYELQILLEIFTKTKTKTSSKFSSGTSITAVLKAKAIKCFNWFKYFFLHLCHENWIVLPSILVLALYANSEWRHHKEKVDRRSSSLTLIVSCWLSSWSANKMDFDRLH